MDKPYKITGRCKCLECGNEIQYTRSNKKFCCQTCKDSYNNKLRRNRKMMMAKVGNALDKNYLFLNELARMSTREISLEDAIINGFNPSFVTSSFRNGKKIDYMCYDIAFRMSESRIFNIHRLSLNLRVNKNEK